MKNVSLLLFLTFILSSCSSYLVSSISYNDSKKKYDNLLIIAVSKNQELRIDFETKTVNKLKKRGITATASYLINGFATLKKPTTEGDLKTLNQTLLKNGFDGIIVTSLIDVKEYEDVIQGSHRTVDVPVRYGRFDRYYGYYPVSYWEDDYTVTGTKYVFESALYDLRINDKDNLQWLGLFELKDPSNLKQNSDLYTTDMVNALLKENLYGDEE